MQQKIKNAALELLDSGFSVFPVGRNKRPLIDTWKQFQKQLPPRCLVGYWFGSRFKDANIGYATGPVSGVDVIDFDPGHEPFPPPGQSLPVGCVVRTPRGGRHHVSAHVPGSRNSTSALARNVDYRGEGGYALAPPSVGENGVAYSYEIGTLADARDAVASDWLRGQILEKSNGSKSDDAKVEPGNDGGIPTGARNDTLTRLAGYLRRKGFSQSAIYEALKVHNAEHCKPPLGKSEIRRIASSVERYTPGDPERPIRGGLVSLAEFSRQEFPPLVSLWNDGTIKSQTIASLVAPTGFGKSITAKQLGMCISAGVPFLNRQTSQGMVAYYQSELNDGELFERLNSHMLPNFVKDLTAEQRERLFDCFLIRTQCAGVYLYSSKHGWEKRFLDEIESDLDTHKPILVIFDPFSDFFRHNEIDNAEIAEALSILRVWGERYGTAFLLPHHPNKASYDKKGNAITSGRGGTKLPDTVSAALELWPMKGQLEKTHVELQFAKLRYRKPAEPIVLRRPVEFDLLFRPDSTVAPQSDKAAASRKCREEIIELLSAVGALKPMALYSRASKAAGVCESYARSRTKELIEDGLVVKEKGRFELVAE